MKNSIHCYCIIQRKIIRTLNFNTFYMYFRKKSNFLKKLSLQTYFWTKIKAPLLTISFNIIYESSEFNSKEFLIFEGSHYPPETASLPPRG